MFKILLMLALAAIGLGTAKASSKGNTTKEFDFAAISRDVSSDPVVIREARLENAEIEYMIWAGGFSQESWEWHLFSTKMIFLIVSVIVIFGVYIAWSQFRYDIRSRPSGTVEDGEHDVTIEMNKISVRSKTIGALVLVFSGVFFFMYLYFVYPMSIVDRSQTKLPRHDYRLSKEVD